MGESVNELNDYIKRQAATVGRKAQYRSKKKDFWVPTFPETDGVEGCLGVIKSEYGAGGPVALFASNLKLIYANKSTQIACRDLNTHTDIWLSNQTHNEQIDDISISPDESMAASGAQDHNVRLWDTATGHCLYLLEGHTGSVWSVSWSPDSSRIASASIDQTIRVWDSHSGICLGVCKGHTSEVRSVHWLPCGRYLLSGSDDQTIRLWDTTTFQELATISGHAEWVLQVSWSPDGTFWASASLDNTVRIWNAHTRKQLYLCKHDASVKCVIWSSDNKYIASGSNDHTIRIWEAATGKEVECFKFPEWYAWRLSWSNDGAFLVSGNYHGIYRFWDTHKLFSHPIEQEKGIELSSQSLNHLTPALRFLSSTLYQLLRLGISAPLSLIQLLDTLLSGKTTNTTLDSIIPYLQPIIKLHWPPDTHTGLIALLLKKLPLDSWKLPTNASPTDIYQGLLIALNGEEITPEPAAFPTNMLIKHAARFTDNMITLLTMIGPKAVTADPGIVLRLLDKSAQLPGIFVKQRKLLDLRLAAESTGSHSTAYGTGQRIYPGGGVEIGNLNRKWNHLLPSQYGYPDELLQMKNYQNALLFRARESTREPCLRPVVVVLDTSPPVFGPVEGVTRCAAHIVLSSLLEAGIKGMLLMPPHQEAGALNSGATPPHQAAGTLNTGVFADSNADTELEEFFEVERREDLVEVWTKRSYKLVDCGRLLRIADSLRYGLKEESGLEPVILLLTHIYFGMEDELKKMKGLRGLFVQYPGHENMGAECGKICEKHRVVAAGCKESLVTVLGEVLG